MHNYAQPCTADSRKTHAKYNPVKYGHRKNSDIKALYERLLAADKTKMCALGAAMKKLVHICYGVVKNQMP